MDDHDCLNHDRRQPGVSAYGQLIGILMGRASPSQPKLDPFGMDIWPLLPCLYISLIKGLAWSDLFNKKGGACIL